MKVEVTIKFTTDVCPGYDNVDFMYNDYLQELNCCVNSPDEESFEVIVSHSYTKEAENNGKS